MASLVQRASVAFALIVALVISPLVAARCAGACKIARAGLTSTSEPACHHSSTSTTASVSPVPHPCGGSDELPVISTNPSSTGDAAAFAALGVVRAMWTLRPMDLTLSVLDESPGPIDSTSSSSNIPLRL